MQGPRQVCSSGAGGPPGEAAGHTAGTGKIISFLRATNAKKNQPNKKTYQGKWAKALFFFFGHLYKTPILDLFKNGFQMALGAELC